MALKDRFTFKVEMDARPPEGDIGAVASEVGSLPSLSSGAHSRAPLAPRKNDGVTAASHPGSFSSSGTAASYLELCSTSEVLTLRTWGAAVRWVTKS